MCKGSCVCVCVCVCVCIASLLIYSSQRKTLLPPGIMQAYLLTMYETSWAGLIELSRDWGAPAKRKRLAPWGYPSSTTRA